MSFHPIGIFDSGVGGTSIWKEIHLLLPHEKTIYLADSINAPYGEKPVEVIKQLSFKNTDKLLSLGCKLIVVACNTATTNAIQDLRAFYNVPFIGIEPAIKPAALRSRSKTIGILATKGTLSSALFSKTSELYTHNMEVIEVEGNGLVELIESGRKDSVETEELLRRLLKPMLIKKIDCLVLGCSHYPYLIPTLKKILPQEVQIIDSGEAVARQTKAILEKNKLLNSSLDFPAPEFFSNKNPEVLAAIINSEAKNYQVSYLDF
ncbi:glutamate racemase [Zunongwangia sp. H14]|uniref:glutamate racemase n=1 Tax=Zunongwangia sp. H14 TaxID=3240792 RepID=UPI003568C475